MRVMFLLFGMALLLCGCSGNTNNTNTDGQQLAQSIVDACLDSLILNAKRYENKVVRVNGIVDHVCVHTGKRLTLMCNSPDMKLRVVASDLVPDFDLSVKGSKATITGVLKRVDRTNEICEAESTHHPGEFYYILCQNIQ